MSYTKHNFKDGDKLYADQLNEMDQQIYLNSNRIVGENGNLIVCIDIIQDPSNQYIGVVTTAEL